MTVAHNLAGLTLTVTLGLVLVTSVTTARTESNWGLVVLTSVLFLAAVVLWTT